MIVLSKIWKRRVLSQSHVCELCRPVYTVVGKAPSDEMMKELKNRIMQTPISVYTTTLDCAEIEFVPMTCPNKPR